MTLAAPTIRPTSNSARRRLAKLAARADIATTVQRRRAERFRRRATLARLGDWQARRAGSWQKVAWRRTAGCGRLVVGDAVRIHVRASEGVPTAYPVGVATCGSVWLCPVCSAKIRTRRSVDIRTAAGRHVGAGGRLVMLTLTVRHGPEHALRQLLDVESEAWRSLQQDERWRSDMRPLLVGQIRSWEITQGLATPGGSWHPHFHVLLFVRPGVLQWVPRQGEPGNAEAWQAWTAWIGDAWANRVEARLGARPNSHGFHVQELDATAAEYVSKIADETARSDLKSGCRSVHGLIDAAGDGEAWAIRGWIEYAEAFKGKGFRAIQWSRGLRDHFGMGKERTDGELAADKADGEPVEVIDKRLWWQLLRADHGQAPPIVRLLEHWEARYRESACQSALTHTAAEPPDG